VPHVETRDRASLHVSPPRFAFNIHATWDNEAAQVDATMVASNSILDKTLREILAEEPELRARLLAMPPTEPAHGISYTDFLNQIDEDTPAEWVKGEIVMTGPASRKHQTISRLLVQLLSTYAEVHELGEVLPAPFQMKLADSGREPDVIFVAHNHLDRLKPTYLDGPADLVVEIISPESIRRDRGDKFAEYERAGIPEYWLIDPDRQQADFYQLDSNGDYHPAPPDADGVYRSTALQGFWLRVAWLWQPPLVRDALRELEIL
jgi:Uma2 family endonuclease